MGNNHLRVCEEYESPKVEVFEFALERGFANSPEGGMDGGGLSEDKW